MSFLKKIKNRVAAIIKAAKSVDKSKGSRFKIICDIIYCKLRFHASVNEYLGYGFYNYKNHYRKNFLLRYHQVKSYAKVNNLEITRSKFGLYERISDLYKRKIISAPSCGEEVFLNFVKTNGCAVIKPNRGSCGVGITCLKYENDQQVLQFFRDIKYDCVCEEFIRQHKALSELNPYSVNTLRVVTLKSDDNEVEVISATLRTGMTPDSFIDNLFGGGLVAAVDINNGIIITHGVDGYNKKYVNHPITNTQLMGLKIPNWDDVIELVKKGHLRLNENKIIGWDIAITENGIDIVEANSAPCPRVMQIADLKPKGEKILKVLNNRKYQIYK